MITAKIVKYYNDYNQKAFDKTFENLDELADWIFDQMQLDYTKKPGCDFLTFPTDRFGNVKKFQYDRIMGDMCTGFTKLTVKVALFFRVGNIQPGKISVQKRCRSGSRNARSERNIQNSILWRCRQWIL